MVQPPGGNGLSAEHGRFIWRVNSLPMRRPFRWAMVSVIVLLAGLAGCVKSSISNESATGSFALTGNMVGERFAFASTRIIAGPLAGKILVTGGITPGNVATPTAELYDPSTGTFTPTGSMTAARAYHTATALSDGTVLVVGGIDGSGAPLNSAELFNPQTSSFSRISPPNIAVWQHVAVPFCAEHSGATYQYSMFATGPGAGSCPPGFNIYVLIAGGFIDGAGKVPTNQATIYNPATQTFNPINPMNIPMAAAAGVLFPSTTMGTGGIPEPDIVIIGGTGPGGASLGTMSLYPLGGLASSPYVGAWQISSFGLPLPVSYPTATVLENEPTAPTGLSPCDGFVMIAGGLASSTRATSNLFYLYKPGPEGAFGAISGRGIMQEARVHHSATLLGLENNAITNAGSVLVAGGEQDTGSGSSTALNTAELYTPAVSGGDCVAGSFALTHGVMTVPRSFAAAAAFRDGAGRVLIAGGTNASQALSSAEIFTP